MSIKENRPLILRSNRFLGSALVERALITNESLEAANEKLLDIIQSGNLKGASLLNILLYDLGVLNENELIDKIVEEYRLGMIDLTSYDLNSLREIELDLDLCWVTFTVPFDRIENFVKIATAYYLSKPARAFWEEQFAGSQIIWYVSSLASIAGALDRFVGELNVEASEGKPES